MTGKELEKIYNEAYKPVYWTAMQFLGNEADAEDIVQETFISFMESYGGLDDTGKVVTLLKKIAANKCLDRIKLAKTDNMDDEFFDSVEAVPEDFLPDSIIESEDARRIVMDIINNSLSEDIRRTLILFYFDDMSTKEIADALGVPQGTVLRRLNFARNKIKKEVRKYEEENKTKLFGMAALPFLSKLFMKEAEQVPFKAMPASLTTALSASSKASAQGAGTRIAASAAKKGTGIMINKIILGGIAAVIVTGASTAGIVYYLSAKADKETVEQTTSSVINEPDSGGNTEPATVDSAEPSSGENSDNAGVLDPDAAVLTKSPVVHGHTVNVPCTVGDLKSMGFEVEEVVENDMVCMVYDGDDNYFAFNCFLKEPLQNTDNVGDDASVVAIELFIIGTDLDFYGVELGMYEKDLGSVLGMPAYTAGRTVDHGRYYYYLGLGDVIYEFYCTELTEDPSKPQMVNIVFGTTDYMHKNTRLADVI